MLREDPVRGTDASRLHVDETGREVRFLAYHEAGHAVAAWHFGVPVLSMTFLPDGKSRGLVRLAGPRTAFEWAAMIRDRELFEARGTPHLAGPIAEKRAGRPAAECGYTSHRDGAKLLLSRTHGSMETIDRRIDDLETLAVAHGVSSSVYRRPPLPPRRHLWKSRGYVARLLRMPWHFPCCPLPLPDGGERRCAFSSTLSWIDSRPCRDRSGPSSPPRACGSPPWASSG